MEVTGLSPVPATKNPLILAEIRGFLVFHHFFVRFIFAVVF